MKKFWAMLAILGIVSGGVVAGSIVACASSAPTVPGDVIGFSTGANFLWESPADQARDLDLMASTGAKWLRLDFPWPSIQPTATTWNWGPFDSIVSLARSKGFSILGLPSYTPNWAKAPGATGAAPPATPATFATFVGALVDRYKGQGVKHWEIWNEPNLAQFLSPPDPSVYTPLLIAAAAAVKAADPSATVISAGLSPATDTPGSQMSPISFVKGMYASGAKGSFDALGMHPYGFPALPTDASSASWNAWFHMTTIHGIMDQNGDGAKKIWMTEYGAPTGTSTGAVSEARQVDFVREALVARAQSEWMGPLFWYSARDAGTNLADREQNFGLWRHDFSPKPAVSAFQLTVESAVGIYTPFVLSR